MIDYFWQGWAGVQFDGHVGFQIYNFRRHKESEGNYVQFFKLFKSIKAPQRINPQTSRDDD